MHFWHLLTALGDTGFTIPAMLLAAFWIAGAGQRSLARRWLVLCAIAGALVALTKAVYMAWCISTPVLNFTGFSGHTTMAALLWPVLLTLVSQAMGGTPATLRHAACAGTALAVSVGISRLQLHVHSVSEVVGGLMLGLALSAAMLRHIPEGPPLAIDRRAFAAGLLALASCLALTPAPSQQLLEGAVRLLVSPSFAAKSQGTCTR